MDRDKAREFVGRNIASARRAAGLSLRQLAEKTGLSHTAISKYEKGLVKEIPSQVVIKIARACGVSVGFILRSPVEVQIEEVNYRCRSRSLSRKVKASVIEKVKYWVENYLEVEELLGEREKTPNIPVFKVSSPEDAEKAANALREAWELGADPIANLTVLLEDHGFKVGAFELPEGIEALTFKANGHYVIAVSREAPADRLRFSLAHELGHICLNPTGVNAERAANRFAGAFLVPAKEAVLDLAKAKSLSEYKLLKRKYGVSIQALLMRAVELGFISRQRYRTFMKALSRLGWRKKEPVVIPQEVPLRFARLISRAVEMGVVSASRLTELESLIHT